MSNRRFAAVACVAAVAALAVPAGLVSAGPGSSGGTKVSAKGAAGAKMSGFKVKAGGAAKSNVPAGKVSKSAKVSP